MTIIKKYNTAKEQYENWGINVDDALKKLSNFKISIHCWQGDDVTGFENLDTGLSGGIATTGNYMGKARTPQELQADMEKALSLIPGKHKINLHAIYAYREDDKFIDRADLKPEDFKNWVEWAKKNNVGLDFNPTLFSHPKANDGFTLSHPDKEIRDYWIKHCINSRKIAEYFGKELKQPSLNNIWIPDGFKDTPSDRLTPRRRLKESLDEIFQEKISKDHCVDAIESKVFGIGVESYTVGSHEFYMNYASKNNIAYLLDNGHFHPTESVADKISSQLLFSDKIALHVTRPVRWDSDHIVTLNEETIEIAKEIVRNDALDKVILGLDFFDASVNRIAAWIIGTRATQKALLIALLTPHDKLKQLQEEGDYTARLALMEEFKTYPLGDIWNYYCESNNVPAKEDWLPAVKEYEKLLEKRK